MFSENTKYEILTPTGWQDFRGITKNEKITYNIKFSDNTEINATEKHIFFVDGNKVAVGELAVGVKIDSIGQKKEIISIKQNNKSDVYDIIEVSDINHQYIVNDNIITKNCDELAFVRPNIAKEFWTSISPTLATGGKAIITSTPNSDEDQFALLWKGANKTEDEFGNQTELGVNGFKAFEADWRCHPDRDDKWAEEELGRIGEERFRREHLNEFVINDETLIAATTLIDLEGIEPIHKTGQVRWYAEPKPGRIYTVALDPSLGTGGDPAAIQVFEVNTTTQIAEWKHNKTTIPNQIRILADIVKYIYERTHDSNSIYYSVENNTIGEAALISLEEYGEHNIPGVFLSEPKTPGMSRRYRKGFNTTHKTKIAACAKFKNLVETGKLKINSKSLVSELKNFVALGTGYAAKPGEVDDLVMATILTIRMMQILKDYHKELTDQLTDYTDEIIEPMPFIAFF